MGTLIVYSNQPPDKPGRLGKVGPYMGNQHLVRWDEKTDTFWLVRPDKAIEKQYDQDHDRIPGQLRWKVRRLTALQKVATLAKVALSDDAPPEVMAIRKLSCLGDPEKGISPCTSLSTLPQGKFCGTCSCNRWQIANLDDTYSWKYTKLDVKCPMRKPGFSNST